MEFFLHRPNISQRKCCLKWDLHALPYPRERLRTGTNSGPGSGNGASPSPGPGHFWSRGLVPVPTIFVPGSGNRTSPGPGNGTRPRPGNGTSPGNGNGHFWSQGLVPVPVPTISGPDDWSRSWSCFNFCPGTNPGADLGPVVLLLKYLYKKCTEILAILSKLYLFRHFLL